MARTLIFLVGATMLGIMPASRVIADGKPVVGAIRWDAWTGGRITEQVERTLGPPKYHSRLPWFAKVAGKDKVRIDGSPQDVMDREIGFAADAGLDYWAFLVYGEASPMSVALKQYLQSSRRKEIGFCIILHNTLHSKGKNWEKERDRAVALLKEPGYRTVLDGRPLVYVFTGRGFPQERFAEFLKHAKQAGMNPYAVFMGWNPANDFKKWSTKGFDAVSAYAKGGNQAAFKALAASVEKDYWQAAAKAKVPYIPLITAGWDKQPRKDHPVSWEKDHGYHKQKRFPARATPGEIAAHLSRGIDFIRKHPETCKAEALIIYAWNEYDEGGWLAPTRGADGKPDMARLDAIRAILKDKPVKKSLSKGPKVH